MKRPILLAIAFTLTAGTSVGLTYAEDTASCPSRVKEAIKKAHPGSTMRSCKEENDKGTIQFEVKLKTPEGRKLEVDVRPDGMVLLTEEEIAVAAIPPAVSAAFAARYPAAKATRAEKQTKPDDKVDYELAFTAKGKKMESTFNEKGSFVSEE